MRVTGNDFISMIHKQKAGNLPIYIGDDRNPITGEPQLEIKMRNIEGTFILETDRPDGTTSKSLIILHG